MPNPYSEDGRRKLYLNDVTQKQLEEISNISEKDFMDQAAKNGWDKERDKKILGSVYRSIQDNKGFMGTNNPILKAAADILHKDLSQSRFPDSHKADLIGYITNTNTYIYFTGINYNNREDLLEEYEKRVRFAGRKTDKEGNEYREYRNSNEETNITNFDYSVDPVEEANNWRNGREDFLKSCSNLWKRPEEQKLVGDLYDCCIGDDGILNKELAQRVKNLPYEYYVSKEPGDDIEYKTDRVVDVKNKMLLIKDEELTQAQKDCYNAINHYLDVSIKEQEREVYLQSPEGKRETFFNNCFANHQYVRANQYDMLSAVYNACKDAPEGSDAYNLLRELESGKPKGYEEASMKDQPALVTSMLVKDMQEVLDKMAKDAPDDLSVNKAQTAVNEYARKIEPAVLKEKEDLPFMRVFMGISEQDQKDVRTLADTMEKDGNVNGKGKTNEFNNMINDMKAFSASMGAGANAGSIAGQALQKAMQKMNTSINAFVASEKLENGENNIQNPNIGLAVGALNTVDPLGAAEHRAQIAKNLYDNLNDTKKEWYDRKDTTEYTNFKEALRDFSQLKPGDEGYEAAKEKAGRLAKVYLEKKKGGLTVDAHQKGGDARRKMAILTVALVDPAAAQEMVNEANTVRAKKGLDTIDLKELARREGFGELKTDGIDKSKNTVRAKQPKSKEAPELNAPHLPGMG